MARDDDDDGEGFDDEPLLNRIFRPAFLAAWVVISLAPWLSLLLASRNDHGFGVREVLATVVAVVIAFALLAAVAGAPRHPDGWFGQLVVYFSLAAGVSVIPGGFAGAFYRLSRARPDAFSEPLSKIDALYFSITTFTTAGFRDISPRSTTARVLVTSEVVAALVVLILAIAIVFRRILRAASPEV